MWKCLQLEVKEKKRKNLENVVILPITLYWPVSTAWAKRTTAWRSPSEVQHCPCKFFGLRCVCVPDFKWEEGVQRKWGFIETYELRIGLNFTFFVLFCSIDSTACFMNLSATFLALELIPSHFLDTHVILITWMNFMLLISLRSFIGQ